MAEKVPGLASKNTIMMLFHRTVSLLCTVVFKVKRGINVHVHVERGIININYFQWH